MKHLQLVIALVTAGLMATAGISGAQTPSIPAKRPPPAASSATTAPPSSEAPRGDTHVHRFFQAWGRGMDRAGDALDKVPKPDKRWPGKADTQRPPDTSPTGDPYSSP